MTEWTMIQFDEGNLRFVYRVVGVAIDNSRVLLAQVEGQDFWFLPGGRGELGEPARDTLVREMREEINAEIRVGRLLWVVENFFTGDSLMMQNNKDFHELGLYFLMEFTGDLPIAGLNEYRAEDDGFKIIYKWHNLDETGDTLIYPSFLREGLKKIPDNTEHIFHRDNI